MFYGILDSVDNKFILIDEDEQRLRNTLPFKPELVGHEIKQYRHSDVEQAYDGGWYIKGYAPEIPPDVAMEQAKSARADAVSKITVEVDALVFDGDEVAQGRMARTITAAQANGYPEGSIVSWVLADNTVATVTIAQLSKALLLAQQAQTDLWIKPYEK